MGPKLTLTCHKMIETSFCHPFIQRIILSKNKKPCFSSSYRIPPVKLVFPSAKLVYVSNGFHGDHRSHLRYKVGNGVPVRLDPQYHVRFLDLDFNNWRVKLLEDLLPSLPLLVRLKLKGCGQTAGWFSVHIWDQMFQHLKPLQWIDIDIYIFYPITPKQEQIQKFNEAVTKKTDTCKRLNLTLGIRDKNPGRGCFQFSASL